MSTSIASPLDFSQLGWSADRAMAFAPHAAAGLLPGRLVSTAGGGVAVTEAGPCTVIVQRRFAREAETALDLPAVGDWLALEPVPHAPGQAALRLVLDRRGSFVRQRSSDRGAQVLAANVDVAFLVSGLDQDLNLRRLERYLVLALEGGVRPVVLLNKADLALDLSRVVADVHAVAAGTRVIVTSAVEGTGLEEVRSCVEPGATACLLGSSGVGKSTITNALLGHEQQATQTLREDDSKGRHTTSHRELFRLAGGGLIIDTPGLRSVGVLGSEGVVEAAFGDVEGLARECRFRDCQHGAEPGCAVSEAIANGRLRPERLDSHRKLEAERRSAELRADTHARRESERRRGRWYRQAKRQLKQRNHKDF